MAEVGITVQGSHRAFRRPERATVRLNVGLEGPTAEQVFAATVASSEQVTETIKALHDPQRGPVTWWSSAQIRTWAKRPWNKDGKQLPLVHHSRVAVDAKFSDFARLSAFLSQMADVRGVSVLGVDWALTEQHRLALVREVRQAAVRDAHAKAQEYADALGLGSVRPVAIADAGMLGEGIAPANAAPAAFSRGAPGGVGDDGGLDLTPQDVEVAAQVDTRFVAG